MGQVRRAVKMTTPLQNSKAPRRTEGRRDPRPRGIDKGVGGCARDERAVPPAVDPSSSLPASPHGAETTSEPWCARMKRSLPVLVPVKPSGISVGLIDATGMVPCEKRIGSPIARDACVIEQRRRGCVCSLAATVRQAHSLHRIDLKDDEHLSLKGNVARNEQTTSGRYPPWQLVCRYAECGKPFEWPRHFGGKPHYCCKQHGVLQRRLNRKAWLRHDHQVDAVYA